jgi:hypothetical protein
MKDNIKRVKFYSHNKETAMFTPKPEPSSRSLPDWYRRQAGSVDEDAALAKGNSTGTIKRCMPIFDAMTAGYLLYFPMDVFVDATDPQKLTWSAPNSMIKYASEMFAVHAELQYDQYPVDTDVWHPQLFRILPFWSAQTEEGFSTLVVHPLHRDNEPFKTVSGLIDTDAFSSDGHFSMHIKKGFKGIIKQGTPFAQLIPIKRESWQMEIASEDESTEFLLKQRLNVRSKFRHSYKEKFRSKKEYK